MTIEMQRLEGMKTKFWSLRKTVFACLILLLACVLLLKISSVTNENKNEAEKVVSQHCNYNRLKNTDVLEVNELEGLHDTNINLIETVRRKMLIGPSKRPYHFKTAKQPNLMGRTGIPHLVDEILHHTRNGFFIEAGGDDGEETSNTLFFEMKRNWTGILIEPNPVSFNELQQRNRKSYTIETCLSPSTSVEILRFNPIGRMGGFITPLSERKNRTQIHHFLRMTCIPFYTIMMALGNPTVHFFSLDIEGAEIPILRTIPFGKLDIKVIAIEVILIGQVYKGTNSDVEEIMTKNGYVLYSHGQMDDIYVKKELL